jgi:hypothetical protein
MTCRSDLRYVSSGSNQTRLFVQQHFNMEYFTHQCFFLTLTKAIHAVQVKNKFFAPRQDCFNLSHITHSMAIHRNQSYQPIRPKLNTTLAATDVRTNFARVSQRAGIYYVCILQLKGRCNTLVRLESRPAAMAL